MDNKLKTATKTSDTTGDTTQDALDKHPNAPAAQHAAEPSGYKGDSPATAGPGPTRVVSNTPENVEGHLNPSAPGNASTTPGTTGDK